MRITHIVRTTRTRVVEETFSEFVVIDHDDGCAVVNRPVPQLEEINPTHGLVYIPGVGWIRVEE